MKSISSSLVILLLVLASIGAQSEIYSWVDKDGKKHFGEEVPKEYLNQSKTLEVKPINTMDATKAPKKPKEMEKTAFQLEQERRFIPPEEDNRPTQNLSSCEQRKKAYEQSVSCYSSCRSIQVDRNGQQRSNVSNCRQCVDVKRPDC